MAIQKMINCKHFEVRGMGITVYGACKIRRGGCETCCFTCALREPHEVQGASGITYQQPGCDRACPCPEKEEI